VQDLEGDRRAVAAGGPVDDALAALTETPDEPVRADALGVVRS